MVKCPFCSAENESGAHFCINCGRDLTQQPTNLNNDQKCAKCGALNPDGTKFCTNCGNLLMQQTDDKTRQPAIHAQTSTTRVSGKKKQPMWPWLIAGIVLIAVIGGGIYAVSAKSAANSAAASSSAASSNAQRESRLKAAETASSIKAENSSLKAAQKDSASAESVAASESSESSESRTKSVEHSTKTTLSASQKADITSQFLDWADGRAEAGNMAVSDYYFNHGAAGVGDWYANTPDGRIQVQDNNHPGVNGFKIHAIGGVIFYTATDGTTGIDGSLAGGSTAAGYTTNMAFDQPVAKYVLGDNGVVYELALGNGESVEPKSGFGELEDDGSIGSQSPDKTFIISKDTAAQSELRRLMQANN